jgi:hypothetical protein
MHHPEELLTELIIEKRPVEQTALGDWNSDI